MSGRGLYKSHATLILAHTTINMSTSNKIRIAIIGTGAFAEVCHIPGLLTHPGSGSCGSLRPSA
jgi:hypothetical protein